MISKLFLLLLLFSGSMVMAGDDDPSLAVTNIPDSLKENSYAVVRNQEITFEVKDLTHAVHREKISITLLNNKYRNISKISIYYRPSSAISSLKGRTYDRQGRTIETLRSKDIKDQSAYTQSLFDDIRNKNFDLSYAEYPYTYEYEFTRDCSSLVYFPTWRPIFRSNMAVQNSTFRVIVPKDITFRYKEMNLPDGCKVEEESDKLIYTWQVKNLKAIEPERIMPDIDRYMPLVITAPDKFIYEKYPGEMSTWESYGEWIKTLLAGRDQLPPEKQAYIRDLVDTIAANADRVRALYEYLQKNTRYVSIQLGIGGNQPFEAGFVDANGYGDCKALSNYMGSLLATAGIRSHYTLVHAGRYESDILPDFPSDQFNHIILCVPEEKDTIWLECTSQVNPFGYLGSFTGNRHVLAITEDGGKIVKTPGYDLEKNLQIRKAMVKFDPAGDALATTCTRYSGLQYENIENIADANPGDQQKWLYENLDIPHFELKKFMFHTYKETIPQVEENLELNMRRYVTVSGKRLFLQPNFLNRQGKLAAPASKRMFEVELKMPYIDVDTIEYEIPAGFHLEYIPEPVEIESRFGNYSCRIFQENNRIWYVRKRISLRGIFPAETYNEYVGFINRIADADNMKLVFVNKT
jgi:hypothetical protein